MDKLQRDMLIQYLANDMEECWEFSDDAFIDGFSFDGFGNMTDEELIGEAQGQDWDDEEWFQKILLAHEIAKEIAKAK